VSFMGIPIPLQLAFQDLSTLYRYVLNSREERLHPCLRPLLTRTGFDNKPPCFTAVLLSLYTSFIASISSSSMQKLLKAYRNFTWAQNHMPSLILLVPGVFPHSLLSSSPGSVAV
jgi:hypothetical protein